MSQKSQKQQGFFLPAKNSRHKYRKNRKNNKSNKIQDSGKEEAKKGLEMSAKVAKIAKVTRIFLACESTPYKYLKNNRYNKIHDFGKEEAVTSVCFVLKTPLTNVAKSARITNLTRFTTLEKKKPREASKCPQISQK